MMEQIKIAVKLLKYSYGVVGGAIYAGIFLVLGICGVMLPTFLGLYTSMLILIAGMWVMQLFYSFGVSKLIRTSIWMKKIETSTSALINVVVTLGLYLVIVVMKLLMIGGADEQQIEYMSNELMLLGIFAFAMMVSSATAYKYFVGTMLLFWVVCVPIGGLHMRTLEVSLGISFPVAVVLGVLGIIAGGLAQYGIALLFYKYPPSKWAQTNALQKYM